MLSGTVKLLGVIDLFSLLIMVMVSQMQMYSKFIKLPNLTKFSFSFVNDTSVKLYNKTQWLPSRSTGSSDKEIDSL